MSEGLYSRIYERKERAQYTRAEYVEITREEYWQLVENMPAPPPPPKGWPKWAKNSRLKLPPGTDGLIFGFPAKVVETLEGTDHV